MAQVQGWGDGVGIGFWSILGPAVWALAGLDALLWSGSSKRFQIGRILVGAATISEPSSPTA
ncbi:MAG: hypothetical protein WCP28_16300 [Actinomycetes bacterium]